MRQQRHSRILAGVVLSGLALALTAGAATSDSSTAPDPRDKMSIWEGRWNEMVQTKETPFSHAASTPAHVTCSWTADRGYMVCEYLSEKPDPREKERSDHLTIFTYNSATKTYKHLGISKDYKTLEEPNVVIEGNLWHYQYQISDDQGKQFELRDSYEFVTPEKRITRIEISADGGQHWTLMSESVGIRAH
jgi:hypothetical protein